MIRSYMLFVLMTTALYAQERIANLQIRPNAVIATGTWKSTSGKSGDELAFKQAVEIDCFRPDKTCMEATASIVGKEPQIAVQYYKVLRWDENGIVAESADALCMTNQLNINFQEKSVIATDAPKRGAKGFKDTCKAVDHTQIYKLVSR